MYSILIQAADDAEALETAALGGSMLRVWPHHWDTVRGEKLIIAVCTFAHPSCNFMHLQAEWFLKCLYC